MAWTGRELVGGRSKNAADSTLDNRREWDHRRVAEDMILGKS